MQRFALRTARGPRRHRTHHKDNSGYSRKTRKREVTSWQFRVDRTFKEEKLPQVSVADRTRCSVGVFARTWQYARMQTVKAQGTGSCHTAAGPGRTVVLSRDDAGRCTAFKSVQNLVRGG